MSGNISSSPVCQQKFSRRATVLQLTRSPLRATAMSRGLFPDLVWMYFSNYPFRLYNFISLSPLVQIFPSFRQDTLNRLSYTVGISVMRRLRTRRCSLLIFWALKRWREILSIGGNCLNSAILDWTGIWRQGDWHH